MQKRPHFIELARDIYRLEPRATSRPSRSGINPAFRGLETPARLHHAHSGKLNVSLIGLT